MWLSPKLVDTIKSSFADRTSEELRQIVSANDLNRWSPDALEAARLLLEDRLQGRAREPKPQSDEQLNDEITTTDQISEDEDWEDVDCEDDDLTVPWYCEWYERGESALVLALFLILMFESLHAGESLGQSICVPLIVFGVLILVSNLVEFALGPIAYKMISGGFWFASAGFVVTAILASWQWQGVNNFTAYIAAGICGLFGMGMGRRVAEAKSKQLNAIRKSYEKRTQATEERKGVAQAGSCPPHV